MTTTDEQPGTFRSAWPSRRALWSAAYATLMVLANGSASDGLVAISVGLMGGFLLIYYPVWWVYTRLKRR